MGNPARIYRQHVLEGFSIPAFIHNGDYYFVDLHVYEDGRVYCWNFEDFASFQRDVRRGWVALGVPEGETFSVSGLNKWRIENGHLPFDEDAFVAYVAGLIQTLNPSLRNLHAYTERRVEGVVVGESGDGTVYKKHAPANFFAARIDGASDNLFYRQDDAYWLVQANVFADGTVQLARLETIVELTWAELEDLVHQQTVLTEVPAGATVRVHRLGRFTLREAVYVEPVHNILSALQDKHRLLVGEPTTVDLCREAHDAYRANPNAGSQAALREAYERIPDQLRGYIGDMDTRDSEVQMLLYGGPEDGEERPDHAPPARNEKGSAGDLPKPEAQ